MAETDRNEPEKLLEVEDVARLLGLNPQKVYEMVRSGELRAFKIGRVWRLRPSDVKAWQDAKAGVEPAEKAS